MQKPRDNTQDLPYYARLTPSGPRAPKLGFLSRSHLAGLHARSGRLPTRMQDRTSPAVAKQPKIGRGSPRPAERRSEPPQHTVQVHATAGKTEPPPSTNVAHVTEFTMAGDWVRRTPSALLILPPPPQFADPILLTHRRPPQLSHPLMPASLPSRSHTAAAAMRSSRSRIAAPATRLTRSHGKQSDEKDTSPPTHNKEDAVRTSYAAIAAAPTHHTSTARPTPPTDNTQAPLPSQQPMLPTLVVKRLPNWVGHFRTIAEALGHAPNARAYKQGVMFLPKTKEELRTVQRCLEEAAASDSAISYEAREHSPSEEEEETKRTHHTHTSPENTTAPRQGTARLPATAVPCEEALPHTTSAVFVPPDATLATTSAAPHTRRRRCRRAPRPTLYSPVAAGTPQTSRRPALLPTPKAGRAPTQASATCCDGPTPFAAPRSTHHIDQTLSSLDLTVRVILEAITTGIAAYLREQGAMSVKKEKLPLHHRALRQEWQARAGEIPAQRTTPWK